MKTTTMKTILVPTDFSSNAYAALRYAASLATLQGYRLHLLHTYVVLYAGYDGEKRTQKLLEQQEIEVSEQMVPLIEKLQAEFPDVEVSGECCGGFVVDKIIGSITEGNYSLVVMGTKGVTNVAEQLLGSTTSEVIARSPIPVLAVPQNVEDFRPDQIGFFSAFDESEINTLLRTRHLLGADHNTTILHLYRSTDSEPSKEASRWEERIRTEFSDGRFDFCNLRVGKLDSATVAQIAQDKKLDLLVFTRPQKSFFSKVFAKSLTRDVVSNLNMPSLFIKG